MGFFHLFFPKFYNLEYEVLQFSPRTSISDFKESDSIKETIDQRIERERIELQKELEELKWSPMTTKQD